MTTEQKQAVERLELFASLGATRREQYLLDQGWDDISTLLKAVREMGEDTKRLDFVLKVIFDKGTDGLQDFLWSWVLDEDGEETEDFVLDRKALDAAISQSGVKEG